MGEDDFSCSHRAPLDGAAWVARASRRRTRRLASVNSGSKLPTCPFRPRRFLRDRFAAPVVCGSCRGGQLPNLLVALVVFQAPRFTSEPGCEETKRNEASQ